METTKREPKRKLAPAIREISKSDYGRLFAEIKERVRSAQYDALRAVNKELTALYWDIGQIIAELLSDASHGEAIVEKLAHDLRTEFPGISGFSRRNMFYMREFHLAYRDSAKVQPLVAQIGWTHNLIILQRCKDSLEREFYLIVKRLPKELKGQLPTPKQISALLEKA
jgi:predicted nuclease of restriction endonuclease-like (RecB) superfamily